MGDLVEDMSLSDPVPEASWPKSFHASRFNCSDYIWLSTAFSSPHGAEVFHETPFPMFVYQHRIRLGISQRHTDH